MTSGRERARTVRPQTDVDLQPIQVEDEASKGVETEGAEESEEVVREEKEVEDQGKEWQEVNEKVGDLVDRVARHFEDANDLRGRKPPVIQAPPQPSQEEMEQHQATHTFYAPWCKHCVAARVIR